MPAIYRNSISAFFLAMIFATCVSFVALAVEQDSRVIFRYYPVTTHWEYDVKPVTGAALDAKPQDLLEKHAGLQMDFFGRALLSLVSGLVFGLGAGLIYFCLVATAQNEKRLLALKPVVATVFWGVLSLWILDLHGADFLLGRQDRIEAEAAAARNPEEKVDNSERHDLGGVTLFAQDFASSFDYEEFGPSKIPFQNTIFSVIGFYIVGLAFCLAYKRAAGFFANVAVHYSFVFVAVSVCVTLILYGVFCLRIFKGVITEPG
ncbi:MAG: hypothetical protein NUW37_19460 [Planctomycetes bacterium]|nr:hypothetical protein [Planctomycetota bacterium]